MHPAKLATPATATTGFPVQLSVPPAGLVPIASVTLLVSVVTVLLPASCTATFGWVVNAMPALAPATCWVKPSFAAGPTVTLKVALVARVREPSVALSV